MCAWKCVQVCIWKVNFAPNFCHVSESSVHASSLIFIDRQNRSVLVGVWKVHTCQGRLLCSKWKYRSTSRFIFQTLHIFWGTSSGDANSLCIVSFVCSFSLRRTSPVWQDRTVPTGFPAIQRMVSALGSQETGLDWISLKAFGGKSVNSFCLWNSH